MSKSDLGGDERTALESAAKRIRFSPNTGEVPSPTRVLMVDKETIEHVIDGAVLVRLRHAAKAASLSWWAQLFWGAVVGIAAPASAAISQMVRGTSLKDLTEAEIWTVALTLVFVLLAVILTVVSRGSGDTVDNICDDLQGLPRKKSEGIGAVIPAVFLRRRPVSPGAGAAPNS